MLVFVDGCQSRSMIFASSSPMTTFSSLLLLGVLSSTIPFFLLLPRLRLCIYRRLSLASDWSNNTRIFCTGIPLVLKASDGTKSTEADALRFLNTHLQGERLPIPIFMTLPRRCHLHPRVQVAWTISPQGCTRGCRERGIPPNAVWGDRECHAMSLGDSTTCALQRPGHDQR